MTPAEEVKPGGSSGLIDSAERGGGLPRALRSRARHLAMLSLYNREAHRFSEHRPLSETLRWLCKDPPRRARARALVEAALAERETLDRLLEEAITDWRLERLGAVERAAMRTAAGELIVLRDAPVGPVVNDAVELARRYGEENSPAFVNAVLARFTELPEVAEILARPASGERPVDLHAHTDFSDGDLSPQELVKLAAETGLVGLGIADHDEVLGVAPALEAGRDLGVEVVPGVEMTAYVGDAEFHILGLFIDPAHPGLVSELERFREGRRKRVEVMCGKLAGLGAPIEPGRVCEIAGTGAVGRPHVAKALVEAGHCSSVSEAFRRYIGDRGPACAPKVRITPAGAISLVHGAGGLAFLAHPGIGGHDEMFGQIAEAGLDGLETRHTLHSEPSAEHFARWVHRRDLLCTGGSDFHGGTLEGRPLGQPFVPETWLIELRNRWKLRTGVQGSGSGVREDTGEPAPGTQNPEPQTRS
ncbi:MAG: transcription antitermination factor NusB [Planctomycetota bacterium]